MRLDSLTVEEALRMARATMECEWLTGGTFVPECVASDPIPGAGFDWADYSGVKEAHHVAASLLLDGFSVAEVTEAGG